MLGEDDLALVAELFSQGFAQEKFLPEPEGHSLEKRADACWSESDVAFQDPLELDKRFIIESHEIYVGNLEPRAFQTPGSSMGRKREIMLDPGEPLLLGRGPDTAVSDQAPSAVMVIR